MMFDIEQSSKDACEIASKINDACVNHPRIVCIEALARVFCYLLQCTAEEMAADGADKQQLNESMDNIIDTFCKGVKNHTRKYDA